MAVDHYDAVVVGAGQGGGPLASAFAEAGKRTALIEREHIGGTCINEGCTPTKTMIASARTAHVARRAGDYGVEIDGVAVDLRAVRERKRAIVDRFREGSEKRIVETEGLELIRGEARFTGPKTLHVALADGNREITADLIVLDVGTRPAPPPLPGLDGVSWLDSTSVMEMAEVPRHLLILGGGYVGVEFGQMFRRFGSRVTIVQRGAQLLGREDGDLAEAVADILREDGVDILLETEACAVAAGPDDGVRLTVAGPDGERTLSGSHLLVAVGRAPNTDGLGLDLAGVTTDNRGYIEVDERLATNAPGVYAIGDVSGGPAFTHISYDDFRVLSANLIEGGDETTRGRMVPYVVFIDPQLGRVGLTEAAARKQGTVRVAKMPMSGVARAVEVDETRGFLKAVVGEDDRMLGFAALGIEGGEIMAMAQMAMMGRLPYTVLRDGVFAHPTLAEAFNNLFANLEA
jgi:pyruvate/2-oxoglutarate dehydrogenase complex dihydrolipoamide dehydrogenase (E3) component